MRTEGTWMSMVESVEKFVERCWDIGEGNPRVFGVRLAFPVHEVVITMTNFPGIKDGIDGQRRVIRRCEWFWRCVRSEGEGVVVGLKERNVEDRV
jgi:hypothetical protein